MPLEDVMSEVTKRLETTRPKIRGGYDEPTKPIKTPENSVTHVFKFVETHNYKLPLYICKVEAGFPSPADDYIESEIDLNKQLIKHPTATFLVKVAGLSMLNAGIHPGDTLIVDRSLEASNGKIVVVAIDGDLTVKRLEMSSKGAYLVPDNDQFSPLKIEEGNDVVIWGVVTNVIHPV